MDDHSRTHAKHARISKNTPTKRPGRNCIHQATYTSQTASHYKQVVRAHLHITLWHAHTQHPQFSKDCTDAPTDKGLLCTAATSSLRRMLHFGWQLVHLCGQLHTSHTYPPHWCSDRRVGAVSVLPSTQHHITHASQILTRTKYLTLQ